MGNVLQYKGYRTRVEFCVESQTLRGKIEGINDLVDFECESVSDVETEFHSAVDDYLDFCREVGKSPDKEYRGSFNVRISPDLHKRIAAMALEDGCSLNFEVERALAEFSSARATREAVTA